MDELGRAFVSFLHQIAVGGMVALLLIPSGAISRQFFRISGLILLALEGLAPPSLRIDAPGPQGGLVDIETTAEADRLVLDVTLSNPTGTLDEILISPSRDATHFSRRTIELNLHPADVIHTPQRAATALAVRPNPTNASATIRLAAPSDRPIELVLLTLGGRRVKILPLRSNDREVVWDGRDQGGRLVPAGVYFLTMTTGVGRSVQKLQVVR